jgi:hypothetical protein
LADGEPRAVGLAPDPATTPEGVDALIERIARATPELALDLPPTAIGKRTRS